MVGKGWRESGGSDSTALRRGQEGQKPPLSVCQHSWAQRDFIDQRAAKQEPLLHPSHSIYQAPPCTPSCKGDKKLALKTCFILVQMIGGGGAAKPVTFQQVLTNGLQRQQAKGLMGQHGLTLGQRRLFLPRLTTTISTSRTCVKLNHKNWTSISIKMNDTLIKGQTSSSFSLLNKMLFYSVLYHNWRHVFGVLSTFLTFQKNALHISTNITLGWSFLSFSPSPLARQRRTIHGQKTLRSMENKKNREQGLFGMPRYLEQTDKNRQADQSEMAPSSCWHPSWYEIQLNPVIKTFRSCLWLSKNPFSAFRACSIVR